MALSLEMIAYQNGDKFHENLTNLIEKIYDEIDSNTYKNNSTIIVKSIYIKKIETLIKDRFNLDVKFDKEAEHISCAAIIPFMSDCLIGFNVMKGIDLNIIKNLLCGINIHKHFQAIEKERRETYKRIHNKKGYIDLKHGRVGGYLSEVRHLLLIDFLYLKDRDLSPAELSAVMLHEIGHAFTGLETHHRFSTTNMTMIDILSDINDNKLDKAHYLFKTQFNEKDLEKASLGNSKEINDFYGELANRYISELNSQMINAKYDETTYENMSDSFASRFGAGRDISSALDKLMDGSVTTQSKGVYATVLSIELILYGILLATISPIGLGIGFVLIIVLFGGYSGPMMYDFPLERYNRIKNNITNNLKNQNLPISIVKDLLEQYEYIDELMKSTIYMKSASDYVRDIISPSKLVDMQYVQLQIDTENVLSNSLFVSSAKVKIS